MSVVDLIREHTGDRYFLMRHGDATLGIPEGQDMMALACRLANEPEKVKAEARAMVAAALVQAERYRKPGGLDGFALCTDYCFNTGPFLSPALFAEFTAPLPGKTDPRL